MYVLPCMIQLEISSFGQKFLKDPGHELTVRKCSINGKKIVQVFKNAWLPLGDEVKKMKFEISQASRLHLWLARSVPLVRSSQFGKISEKIAFEAINSSSPIYTFGDFRALSAVKELKPSDGFG